MENVKFQVSSDDQNRISSLEISGLLVLENAQQIKIELLRIVELLSNQVKISINEPDEMDLSFIQLLLGFIRRMEELNVTYQFNWNLDEDQKFLFEHVGLSKVIYMNN
jgi:hypothetical protein